MDHFRLSIVGTALLLSAPFLQGCGLDRCMKGSGPSVERTLTIDPFQGINLQGSMDVEFHTGTERAVNVTAQANIADLLETKVNNGIWNISTRECYSSSEPFVIRITAPTLETIHLNGSGNVRVVDPITVEEFTLDLGGSGSVHVPIDARRIKASVQGSGDIVISGSCGVLTANVQGSGDIDAGSLPASNVKAFVKGSGDITVYAIEHLDGSIVGSGNINFRGMPNKIFRKVTGSGEFKQLP